MEMSEAAESLAKRTSVTVIKGKRAGEGLDVSYCPALATPENLDALESGFALLNKEDRDFTEEREATIDVLIGMGAKWGNVEGNNTLKIDGVEVGHDRASFRRVSYAILQATVIAIFTSERPNEPGETA